MCDRCKCFTTPYLHNNSCAKYCQITRNATNVVSCTKCCLQMASAYQALDYKQTKLVTCCCCEEGVIETVNRKQNYNSCSFCYSKIEGTEKEVHYEITNCCCSSCMNTNMDGFGFYLCCTGYFKDKFSKLWRCCCFEIDCNKGN